ncbi:MAG: MCE family protein [Actinomycetes bacterium]
MSALDTLRSRVALPLRRAGHRPGANAASRPRAAAWRQVRALLAAGLAVLVVLATIALWPTTAPATATAFFPRAVGLYPGSDVRILGVKVGTVTAVEPQGTTVKVRLEWDASHKVPADAKAVIVAPSVVSDRDVHLTPGWRGGPALRDGATIPESRTAVPVELDRIYGSLDDLSVALGPNGANKDGSLSRLLDTAAANLDGEGGTIHTSVQDLSQAVQTLADGKDDLFGTVRHLQAFTSALAADDDTVRAFNADLATVAEQLSGERGALAQALHDLGTSLGQVATFVRDNKAGLEDNVAALAEVTQVLVKQRAALEELAVNAPTALSNLQLAYNPDSRTLDTRNNFEQTKDPLAYLCSLVTGLAAAPGKTCAQVVAGVGQLPVVQQLLADIAAGQTGGSAALPGGSAPDPTLGGLLGGRR